MAESETQTVDLALEMVLVLRKPVTFGKDPKNQETYSELKLREPTAGELDKFFQKQLKQPGLGAFIYLIAATSGVEEVIVSKIGALDLREAIAFFDPFVDVSPRTGATSSQS